jgi:quinol monooxygenase YgiN
MIILVGCMRVAAGKRDDALIALGPLVEGSRAESGCVGYSMGFDILDDHLLHIFEAFEDEDALKAHRATGHVAEWETAATLLGISDLELNRYDAKASA